MTILAITIIYVGALLLQVRAMIGLSILSQPKSGISCPTRHVLIALLGCILGLYVLYRVSGNKCAAAHPIFGSFICRDLSFEQKKLVFYTNLHTQILEASFGPESSYSKQSNE